VKLFLIGTRDKKTRRESLEGKGLTNQKKSGYRKFGLKNKANFVDRFSAFTDN
jgi:hypothetical protein